MKTPFLASLLILVSMLLIAALPEQKKPGKGSGQGGGAGVEQAVVPPYLFNVWLCRPGAESIEVSVLAWEDMDVFVTYGEGAESMNQRSAAVKLKAGEPQSLALVKLKPDTRYVYQLTYRRASGEATQDLLRSFHTQRATGSSFTFTMQADSHLDTSTDVRVYQQTLANMLADKPDFMVDLGDTTMVDKFGKFYTRPRRSIGRSATTWDKSRTVCRSS